MCEELQGAVAFGVSEPQIVGKCLFSRLYWQEGGRGANVVFQALLAPFNFLPKVAPSPEAMESAKYKGKIAVLRWRLPKSVTVRPKKAILRVSGAVAGLQMDRIWCAQTGC